MQVSDSVADASPAISSSNIAFLVASSFTAALCLILLLVFRIKFYPSAPIVSILTLLLFNDFFQIALEIPSHFAASVRWVCLTSAVGTTFFRLASNFWLIFITRLIYRQKAAPGKQIDLGKHISKNLLIAYVPSIIISLFVGVISIISNLFDTQNQLYCWKDASNKLPSDYIIYISSFLLPNFVALLLLIGYLMAYIMLRPRQHSLFLTYPIVAVPFMIYYLVVKLMTFIKSAPVTQAMEVPLIIDQLFHAIIFIVVLKKLSKSSTEVDDLTIKDDSFTESFLKTEP